MSSSLEPAVQAIIERCKSLKISSTQDDREKTPENSFDYFGYYQDFISRPLQLPTKERLLDKTILSMADPELQELLVNQTNDFITSKSNEMEAIYNNIQDAVQKYKDNQELIDFVDEPLFYSTKEKSKSFKTQQKKTEKLAENDNVNYEEDENPKCEQVYAQQIQDDNLQAQYSEDQYQEQNYEQYTYQYSQDQYEEYQQEAYDYSQYSFVKDQTTGKYYYIDAAGNYYEYQGDVDWLEQQETAQNDTENVDLPQNEEEMPENIEKPFNVAEENPTEIKEEENTMKSEIEPPQEERQRPARLGTRKQAPESLLPGIDSRARREEHLEEEEAPEGLPDFPSNFYIMSDFWTVDPLGAASFFPELFADGVSSVFEGASERLAAAVCGVGEGGLDPVYDHLLRMARTHAEAIEAGKLPEPPARKTQQKPAITLSARKQKQAPAPQTNKFAKEAPKLDLKVPEKADEMKQERKEEKPKKKIVKTVVKEVEDDERVLPVLGVRPSVLMMSIRNGVGLFIAYILYNLAILIKNKFF